jgi:uncharacterized membrane protein
MNGPVVKSVSFSPIGPWPLVAIAAAAVIVLTIWAYRTRLAGTMGRWRWVALGLRLAAVLLCLLAAVRPSVILMQKVKQTATMIFLVDDSSSMGLRDEVRGQSRWEVARKGMGMARDATKKLSPGLEARFYRFNSTVSEEKPDSPDKADGKQTALGTALMESLKRQSGNRVAGIVIHTDGASNEGLAPLSAAQHLRSQQVPVFPVGVGSESAGAASRDIAVRSLDARGPVFVKNKLLVGGTLNVRGYGNQPLEVELRVEGEDKPVAKTTVRAAEGREVVTIRGLEYIPQTPGEKKVTLSVKPKEGELNKNNNEVSTFVSVLKGGLNVLYIHGSNFSWEYKYLVRALDPSPDIHTDLKVIRKPAQENGGEIKDDEFAPGRYDVYVIGDLPANFLTPIQQRLLVRAVERNAGLIMLGGRASFGAGGWTNTDIGNILPTEIHPGDGQMEPENGIKVIPEERNLDNYVLRLGPTRTESKRIWGELPPITGANRLGPARPGATVMARSPDREPLMVGQDVGKGRVLAFGGETWGWARASEETQLAHRKFWRQGIFWLAHKENQGESQVKLKLDRRRLAVGEKLEMIVTARDPKNEPITDAKYETTVTRIGPGEKGKDEPGPPLYNQGEEARGSYFATAAGEYLVTVNGFQNGKDLGQDKARFLVYQDDRELENPAADFALLRQIAELTSGKFLTPEQLGKYLKSLDGKAYTDYVSQSERRIWDNWYFFLLFVVLLTAEWWLRKRHGWV